MMSAEVFEQETHSLSRALTPSPSPLHSPHRVSATQCITIEQAKENFYYGEKLYWRAGASQPSPTLFISALYNIFPDFTILRRPRCTVNR